MSYPTLPPVTSILLVDDDAMPRHITARLLREEGFYVVEAAGCGEAMDKLRASHDRVDLAMLDVVMPDCDGLSLAKDILRHWPDQRILFMSAYPEEVLMQHGLDAFEAPFLTKPYSHSQLLAKVHSALAQAPRSAPPVAQPDEQP